MRIQAKQGVVVRVHDVCDQGFGDIEDERIELHVRCSFGCRLACPVVVARVRFEWDIDAI